VGGGYLVYIVAAGAYLVEVLLEVLALQHLVAVDHVTGEERPGAGVLAVIAVDHGLYQYGGVVVVLLIEVKQLRYALERDLQLRPRVVEEALRYQVLVGRHQGLGLGARLVRIEGLAGLHDALPDLGDVLVAPFELGYALFYLEHAAREERHLVRAEILPYVLVETADGGSDESEVVQRRIVGDGKIGRDDELKEERFLVVAIALLDDRRYFFQVRLYGADHVEVGHLRSDHRIDDEAGQYRESELGELVRLPPALAERLQVSALGDRILLAKEMHVGFHGISLLKRATARRLPARGGRLRT